MSQALKDCSDRAVRRLSCPLSFRASICVVATIAIWAAIRGIIIVGSPKQKPFFNFVDGFVLVRSNTDNNRRDIASSSRSSRTSLVAISSEAIGTTMRATPHQRQLSSPKKSKDWSLNTNCTKSHSLTVCLVPPPPSVLLSGETNRTGAAIETHDTSVWNTVTKIRVTLRDPGLFRWPPHVNLLYPFVRDEEICNGDGNGDTDCGGIPTATPIPTTILAKLRRAAKCIEPFWVSLDIANASNSSSSSSSNINSTTRGGFGTFGGPSHGVLWVYPKSFRKNNNTTEPTTPTTLREENNNRNKNKNNHEPILELQALLEAEFPMCSESLKQRSFLPHMTLSSKFESIGDALAAAATLSCASVEAANTNMTPTAATARAVASPLSFWCKEFYLLERDGDDGQFQRRATIALGKNDSIKAWETTSRSNTNMNSVLDGVRFHDPPLGFPGMPVFEDHWVRAELEALKARRTKNHRNNRRRGTGTRKSYRARKKARNDAEALASATPMPMPTNANAKRAVSPSRKQHDTAEEIARKRAERKARREGAAQWQASTQR